MKAITHPKAQQSFVKRVLIYFNERFPPIKHGLLITAFTFSAISFSLICRNKTTFIDLSLFTFACLSNFFLFFLLRVTDEHKDHQDDLKYRTYLPVPRGLISLKELRVLAYLSGLIILTLTAFAHFSLFIPLLITLAYLALMTKEFFVPKWLKKHQAMYVFSHMLIIPLVDLFGSGFDWIIANEPPHPGLLFFLGVSFFNGIVLEIGRKLKGHNQEEPGVVSYSGLYGPKGGALRWIMFLTITWLIAIIASQFAQHPIIIPVIISLCFAISLFIGFQYYVNPTKTHSKNMENISGIWALTMYTALGAGPMIAQLV